MAEVVNNALSVPLASLSEWKENPRVIKDKDYKRLKRQLRKLKQFKPLIAIKNQKPLMAPGILSSPKMPLLL